MNERLERLLWGVASIVAGVLGFTVLMVFVIILSGDGQ